MWTRSELKEKGKTVFRATYWKCVLVALISAIVTGSLTSAASAGANVGSGDVSYNLIPSHDGFNGFRTTGVLWMLTAFVGVTVIVLLVGLALDICIFNPLEVGTKRFFVYNLNRPAELNELGFGFSGNYVNTIKIMFKKELYTFLWSLLFVIPGIVKAYEYRMIPYLLAENPNISEEEAFGRSRQMMDGQKWNVFVLDLSFIGWHILGVLTLGLVDVFWTQPYQEMTNAALYERFMYGTPAGGDGSGYYNGGYNNSGFGNNGCNNGGYGGNGFNNGGYGGNGYNSGSYGNNGGYGGNGYNNGGYSGNGYNNGGYSGSGFNNVTAAAVLTTAATDLTTAVTAATAITTAAITTAVTAATAITTTATAITVMRTAIITVDTMTMVITAPERTARELTPPAVRTTAENNDVQNSCGR